MRIPLLDWRVHGRTWILDVVDGSAVRWPVDRCHGFVDFLKSEPISGFRDHTTWAVYVQSGDLWLQVNAQRWDMAGLTFRHERDESGRCRFRALRYGETLVSLRYSGPLADPVNRNDPSFDGLDEEVFDFGLFLARNADKSSWRDDVLAGWAEGFSAV